MDFTAVKRIALKVFIGFLALTALIAIACVLGGEFGETEGKILATTSTISAASICSMSGAAFISRRANRGVGLLGILLSVATAILVICGMWPEVESTVYWKTTGTSAVLALAFAHSFLLALPDLDRPHRWIQIAVPAAIGVLSAQIAWALWAEVESELYYRFVAVTAIVVGLATLVVPIMMKLRKAGAKERERIVLERLLGDIYKDASGNSYRVTRVDAEPESAGTGSGPVAGA